MTKGLKTLMRLEKNKIDQHRREMVVLEVERDALIEQSKKMLAELEAEMALVDSLTELRGFFGGFSERIKKRRMTIDQQVALLDRKIAAIREKLSMCFSELKKFEIALENHHIREKAKAERLEQMAFDDIAIDRHAKAREERP